MGRLSFMAHGDTGETQPRCALVTGGSRGLGRAIVETLCENSWRVAFTWNSNREAALEVEERCHGKAHGFGFDLRNRDGARELATEVEEQIGAIEGLVNNAGIQKSQLLAMTSDDDWDEIIDTNLGGAFRCCRAVLPGMVRRRRGSIVSIASLGALRGVAGQSAYAASKAGVLAMTRSLAREMGRRNIRVNAVVPGYVETDMTASLPEQARQTLRAAEALQGGVGPQAVADAVLFLLSDRAKSITGQSLSVDAGASA